MLRRICEVKKKVKVTDEHVRGSVKVASVANKFTENRLKWYRYICEEEGTAHAKKNGRCTGTREEMERKTEGREKSKQFWRHLDDG